MEVVTLRVLDLVSVQPEKDVEVHDYHHQVGHRLYRPRPASQDEQAKPDRM